MRLGMDGFEKNRDCPEWDFGYINSLTKISKED